MDANTVSELMHALNVIFWLGVLIYGLIVIATLWIVDKLSGINANLSRIHQRLVDLNVRYIETFGPSTRLDKDEE